MNHDHSPFSEENTTQDSGANTDRNETPPAGGTVREAIEDLTRSLRNVLNTGSREVRRSLEEALPKSKEDLAKGIHDIAYALAYTAAFGNTLAGEITPDNVKEGFREGARSGQSAAEKMLRQRREKAEREKRENPPSESTPGTVWT